MTWAGHGIFNGAVLWTLTHNLEWTAGGIFLAHLPDWLEFSTLPHRGPTHLLSLWGAAAAAAWLTQNQYAEILTAAGLLHLAADAFSESGIPIWPVSPLTYDWKTKANRLRIACYKTGRLSEYIFIFATLSLMRVFLFFESQFGPLWEMHYHRL